MKWQAIIDNQSAQHEVMDQGYCEEGNFPQHLNWIDYFSVVGNRLREVKEYN